MSSIKKHQCPSCGGNLSIDNDKQMYVCTFCGSTYDYEYFREDQMHKMANTYLSRGEYLAAKDAYKFILKKDPHDFLALRGLMLSAASINNTIELDRDYETKDFTYDSRLVSEAVDAASEEDKEYFMEFAKVYSDRMRLVDCYKDIEAQHEKKRMINDTITINNLTKDDYYFEGKYGQRESPRSRFTAFGVLNAIMLSLLIMDFIGLIQNHDNGEETIAIFGASIVFNAIICIGLTAYIFIRVFPRVKAVKEIDAENKELYEDSGAVDSKIRQLEKEADKFSDDIKRSVHDFVRKDRQIMGEYEAE